jgi:CBS domain containing-hemolysin-like protein/mannitol/fructose-specific phosphotransferase system IIA component
MIVFFLMVALFLLLLNAFFVLAEFAAVKIRPSRIEELIDAGKGGATAVKHVQDHLDEYLSVCQVGITFASIGLGFVAEPAVVRLIEPLVAWTGLFAAESRARWLTSHGIAFAISYLMVSYLHILFGELVPKSVAIRMTEESALWSSRPLRLFRILFFVPLWFLNSSANAIMRLIGLGTASVHDGHSESELRILLDQSQSRGLISFRRLLYMENVFDLGELRVRDAMRPRSQVRCLFANLPWHENLQTIRRFRFTRYPLIVDEPNRPTGLVHLKDLLLHVGGGEPDLKSLARPLITARDDSMLEALLAEMQRKRIHAALVENAEGEWCGFLTLEDVIEEIVGTIRDEFEDEEHIHLAEAVQLDRIHLDIEADGPVSAVRQALARMRAESLPLSKEQILRAIEERERAVGTYLGRNIGMPHARLTGLQRPFVMVLRSTQGIPYPNTTERADLLFVLLTPAGQPRVHQRLQAVIATMLDESEFVPERLRTAASTAEVLEVIRTAEQTTLD